mmetsp:Transcript_16933/g.20335  ORF Transcript_16933/g.20335 Transcript_16933/m.20335 type:complete len:411 (-) Transcript_16933:138-1370(-)
MSVDVVGNGFVHDFVITDLDNSVEEEIIFEGRRSFHHNLDCTIMLFVLHVKIDSGLVQSSTFACSHDLRHIELAEEDLAVFHDLFWYMFCVEDTQLGKDSNMGILQSNSLLEKRHNVSEVTEIRIVSNNFIDVVGVLDNFKTTLSCQPELLGTKTCKADLLPSGNVIGLACGSNSLSVFFEMDVTESQLGIVVNIGEQYLGSLVESLREASVADGLDVCNIGSIHEDFHISQVVGLGISINEFSVKEILLHALSCHLEVRNEFGPNARFVGLITNNNILAGIFCVDETLDGFGGEFLFELCLTKLRPDRLLVTLRCICLGTLKILHEVNKNTNGKDLHFNLFFLLLSVFDLGKLVVNAEGFFVKHVTFRNTDERNILGIKVVELINVSSNTCGIGPNGGKNKQVLKIFVI